MRRRLAWLTSLILSFIFLHASGQDTVPMRASLAKKYVSQVEARSSNITTKIDRQTERYLAKLQKQEAKLYRQLSKIDSLAANSVFSNAAQKYERVRQHLKNKSNKLLRGYGEYTPWLDTATTALKFLELPNLSGKMPIDPQKLKGALAKVNELQDQLKQAENVKEFIRQRKEYLQEQLKKYNLGKHLQKFNKEAYYYTQQINEYKAILDDPSKIEAKAIALLRKIPAFEKFMQQNGVLAGLFNIPKDYASNMTGLQTISQVRSMLEDRMSMAGPNANQVVQQNIGAAQSALSQLRDKISKGGTGEADMPDSKPNTQRTKSFLKRLEFGTNLQSTKSNLMFPMTTDIGLSIGYKLNDKSIVGIGGSYKLGLGKNWNDVEVSHQGIGLRSFVDFKIKGSLWLSGGGELNYRSQYNDLSIFDNYTAWQKSALLGLGKKYSLGKKFKGNVQLLYDFLYNQQIPRSQPVVFRAGYTF